MRRGFRRGSRPRAEAAVVAVDVAGPISVVVFPKFDVSEGVPRAARRPSGSSVLSRVKVGLFSERCADCAALLRVADSKEAVALARSRFHIRIFRTLSIYIPPFPSSYFFIIRGVAASHAASIYSTTGGTTWTKIEQVAISGSVAFSLTCC